MTDVAERIATKPPAAPVFIAAAEEPPAAPETPEGTISPEFDTKDLPIALHTRLAMDKDALDPGKKDLPEVKDADLNNLESSIKVAEDASTAERVDYWEKRWQEMVTTDPTLKEIDGNIASSDPAVKYGAEKQKAERMQQVWISEVVEKVQQDTVRLAVLTRKSIGGINISGFKAETARQIYDRYFQDDGQGKEVEVVIVKKDGQEKITIPSRIKRFTDDILEYYIENGQVNYSKLSQELDNWHWYGGIFGNISAKEKAGEKPIEAHANDIIRDIIQTKIKLADAQKRELQLRQTNQQAQVNNQPTFRSNWLNAYEDRELTYLKVQSQKTKRATIPRTTAAQPTPTAQPTGERAKLFYERLKKDDRMFPREIDLSKDRVATVLALREFKEIGGNLDQPLSTEQAKWRQNRINSIKEQIDRERESINQFQKSTGITDQDLSSLIFDALQPYEKHLSDTYQVKLPNIRNLHARILTPTEAKYYNPHKRSLAFVNPKYGSPFIDWEVLTNKAREQKIDLGKITPTQFNEIFITLLRESSLHELEHLHADITYWWLAATEKEEFEKLTADEKKNAYIETGRLGILLKKIKITSHEKSGEELIDVELEDKERGRHLMEAVTSKLAFEFFAKFYPGYHTVAYPKETEVLDEIIQKTGIPFTDFVRAYFGAPDSEIKTKGEYEFRHLAEKLSGKFKGKETGQIMQRRPHYLEIVYALMEHDYAKYTAAVAQAQRTNSPLPQDKYPLTLAYVRGNFTDSQRQELTNLLTNTPDFIQLPPQTKIDMASQLGIPYEPPKKPATPPADERRRKKVSVNELMDKNIESAGLFIEKLRDRKLWKNYDQKRYQHEYGFFISKDREWFYLSGPPPISKNGGGVNEVAQERYKLPLAIYMPTDHAMLVTRGPYKQGNDWYINVWNPFHKDTRPVKLNNDYSDVRTLYDSPQSLAVRLYNDHIWANNLYVEQYAANPQEANLEKLLEDPQLAPFKNVLRAAKFNDLQKDVMNCVPYCLFTGGLLNALKSGDTPFKRTGIQKFLEDYRVNILTREEILS